MKKHLIALALVFAALASVRLAFPELNHADEYSDANLLIAGENFDRLGFIRCRFLPVFEPNADSPDGAYTHYPPLCDNFNGVLRRVFRTDSLRFFRFVSLLFSFAGLVFWYVFLSRFSGSRFLALLGSLFYLSNPAFLYGIDSLGVAYTEFLKTLILMLFIMYAGNQPRRRFLGLLLMTALVMVSLITYEYMMYFSLFFLAFHFAFRREYATRLKELVPFIGAPVFAFALHLAQNAWFFGSIPGALADLGRAFIFRVAERDTGAALTLPNWLVHVAGHNISLVFMFETVSLILFGLVTAAAFTRLPAEDADRVKKNAKLFLLFLVCGFTWYVVFPSHSLVHTFLTFLSRHLNLAAALGFALAAYALFRFIQTETKAPSAMKIAWLALCLAIVVTGLAKSEIPLTRAKIERNLSFASFKECLLSLKKISSGGETVATNYFRYPFMQYYTKRHFSRAFSPQELQSQGKLPDYFIFFPYESAEPLYQSLMQTYEPLFRCQSRLMPAVFMKLKADRE